MGRIDIIVYSIIPEVSSADRLVEAVGEYCLLRGIMPVDFIVERTESKPYIRGISGLECSVSHSGALWTCAFSDRPVGVDVEKEKEANFPGISGRFFHPSENIWLSGTGYTDFFSIWTAKESYVKRLGTGIADGFSEFSVADGNGLLRYVNGSELRHIPLEKGYRMCVCAEIIDEVFIHDRRK